MSESPVRLVVHGIPPKKDGANSMWRKGQDVPRLKALRTAVCKAMQGRGLFRFPGPRRGLRQ